MLLYECMRIEKKFISVVSLLLIALGEYLIWNPPGWLSKLSFFRSIDQFIRPGIPNPGETIVGFLFVILAIILLVTLSTKNDRLRQDAPRDTVRFSPSIFRTMVMLLFPYIIFLWALEKGQYSWFFPIVWMTIPILIGWYFSQSEISAKRRLPAVGWIDILTFLSIFLIAFLGMSYRLAEFPNIVMGDEPAFFVRAKTISEGNEHGTIFDSGVYTFPLLGNFYQGLFLFLGGPTVFAWRLSSVVAATTTFFPLYLLVRLWFGKYSSLLTFALLITLPYFLAFSRLGYSNIHAVPIVTMIVMLLYKASLTKRLSLWYFVGALSGLGFYSYPAAQIGMLIALSYIIALVWIGEYSLKSAGRILLCLMLGFILIYAPYAIKTTTVNPRILSHKWTESIFFNTWNKDVYFADVAATKTQILVWKVDRFDLFFEPELWTRILLRGVARTAFVFLHPDIVNEHFVVGPLAGGIPTSILFLLGWSTVLRGFLAREKRMILLVIWFLSCFLFLSALNTIGARWTHMIPVVPVLAIVMALGTKQLYATALNIMLTSVGANGKLFLWLVISIFVAIGIYNNVARYFLLAEKRYQVDFMVFQPLSTMFQFGAQ